MSLREIREYSRLFNCISWRPPARCPSPRATHQNWTDHLRDWHGKDIAQSQQSLLQSSHCGKVYWFHDLLGVCRYQNHSNHNFPLLTLNTALPFSVEGWCTYDCQAETSWSYTGPFMNNAALGLLCTAAIHKTCKDHTIRNPSKQETEKSNPWIPLENCRVVWYLLNYFYIYSLHSFTQFPSPPDSQTIFPKINN